MEGHKKIYLKKFVESAARRLGVTTSIDGLRSMIQNDETKIRESYSESTDWIESHDFVNMILHDCVFILEFILRKSEQTPQEKIGDPLLDVPCLEVSIDQDLIVLENQLPYFILEKLFLSVFPEISFWRHVVDHFGFNTYLRNKVNILHFTDLYRLVRVANIPEAPPPPFKLISMSNAVKLCDGEVKFKHIDNKFRLYVSFENDCLTMPCLEVDDGEEIKLRNIMALEQCHYPYSAHVCNYITFLDYLIDTEKDVDLLIDKGIINNFIGSPSSVAEMVNKLGLGITYTGSYCSDVADNVTAYYTNPLNKAHSTLKNVYFSNVWMGTATVAAILLLLFTLIQAVCSLIQILSGDTKIKVIRI